MRYTFFFFIYFLLSYFNPPSSCNFLPIPTKNEDLPRKAAGVRYPINVSFPSPSPISCC